MSGFVSGFVFGSGLVRVRFVSGSYLVRVWVGVWFVFDRGWYFPKVSVISFLFLLY